ncbi:hypothetical protein [Streptomyces sp. NPDC004682]
MSRRTGPAPSPARGSRCSAPLSAADTSALSRFDWSEIRYHRATALGDVLFNAWD